jgi:hypothetical protein
MAHTLVPSDHVETASICGHFSPISRLLDGGLRHSYAGRDSTRGQLRGCSLPPKLAGTGGAVWELTSDAKQGVP